MQCKLEGLLLVFLLHTQTIECNFIPDACFASMIAGFFYGFWNLFAGFIM